MMNGLRGLITGVLLVSSAAIAQQPSLQLKTIPDSINFIWKNIEQDFASLAEAMPEGKWSFKSTHGEFKDVRTFGEQVKHVVCANEAWAKQMSGEKPPSGCDNGGPNPAKTKTEILAYLRNSFTMIDKVIAETSAEFIASERRTVLGSNRLSALTATVWHISDHYGQLVEYLRMNGIVPPARRK